MKVPALLAVKNFYPDFTCTYTTPTSIPTVLTRPGAEYTVTIWSISETWVIMVCGSLPGMKPLLDRYLPKGLQDSDYSSNRHRGRPDDYGLANIRPVAVSVHETRIECEEPQRRVPRVDPEDRWIRATTQIDIQTESLHTDEKTGAVPTVYGCKDRI